MHGARPAIFRAHVSVGCLTTCLARTLLPTLRTPLRAAERLGFAPRALSALVFGRAAARVGSPTIFALLILLAWLVPLAPPALARLTLLVCVCSRSRRAQPAQYTRT